MAARTGSFQARVIRITRQLSKEVDALAFTSPVAHVYNPLAYARRGAEAYVERFARPGPEAILLGMNPGPWGMAQTGVPFGEVELVRDWLGIEVPVGRPPNEHPKRPVLGFECQRSEVSGRRVWSWARDCFVTPEAFFERFFVWNYCPLAFLEDTGRNRTPDKLPAAEREPLEAACDGALLKIVALFEPAQLIGIGAFAAKQATKVLGPDSPVPIGQILHPSPASPIANRGWAPQAEAQLEALGIRLP